MHWPRLLGFSLFALLTFPGIARAGDWPQWRGPDRNGIATGEPTLVSSWPKDGPVKVWEYPAPGGAEGGLGSVVVAGGRAIFVMSTRHDEPVATRRLGIAELQDLGWFAEQLPEELAAAVEPARLSDQRAALKPDQVGDWVEKWLASQLGEEQRKEWGWIVRDRLNRGRSAISLDTLSKLGQIKDRLFQTQEELEQWLSANAVAEHAQRAVNAAAVKTRPAATDTVVCLDALTGKEIWKTQRPGRPQDYGSSGTPCVTAGRCYFLSSAGWAYCLSLEDGGEVWRAKARAPSHASFLVADGLAVVPASELMAFDADSGKEVWTQPKVKSGYNSPVLWRSGSAAYLICNMEKSLAFVELATGKLLWTVPGGLFSSASVTGDHMAVLNYDEKAGLSVYELAAAEPRLLWSFPFRDRGASPVIYDGHVYAVGTGKAFCVSLDTGQKAWERDVGASSEIASPLVADGKLITGVEQTKLLMMTATPHAANVLAQADAHIKFSTSPAIANGKLYLRLVESVACYELAKAVVDRTPY